jgi:hypothetical protein
MKSIILYNEYILQLILHNQYILWKQYYEM